MTLLQHHQRQRQQLKQQIENAQVQLALQRQKCQQARRELDTAGKDVEQASRTLKRAMQYLEELQQHAADVHVKSALARVDFSQLCLELAFESCTSTSTSSEESEEDDDKNEEEDDVLRNARDQLMFAQCQVTDALRVKTNRELFWKGEREKEEVCKIQLTSLVLDKAYFSAEDKVAFSWNFGAHHARLSKKLMKREQLRADVGRSRNGDYQCQLSRVWGNKHAVVALRLLEMAADEAGEKISAEVMNQPDNVLIVAKNIAKAYLRGQICFMRGMSDRHFILECWDRRVLKESVHDDEPSVTVCDCLGKSLWSPKEMAPPTKRILSDHAHESYKHAVGKGWISPNLVPPPESFGSPLHNNELLVADDDDVSVLSHPGGGKSKKRTGRVSDRNKANK